METEEEMQKRRTWQRVWPATPLFVIALIASCGEDQVAIEQEEEVPPEAVGDGWLRESTVGRTPYVKSREVIERENDNRVALAAAKAEIDRFSAEEIRQAHRDGLWAKRWPEIWGPRGFDPGHRFAPPPPFSPEFERRFRELGATDEEIESLRAPIVERYHRFLEEAQRRGVRRDR